MPGVARPDDAPGAERAGELERRAAGVARDPPRRLARVAFERHVDVVDPAAEQPVAHRAADQPRLAAGQRLARRLERVHRCSLGTRADDPARDLVVDRAHPPRQLLGEDAVAAAGADEDRLAAARRRVVPEVDGDVVHRHGADDRHAAAGDEHVGVVGQRAAVAVAVADRDRPEPGGALGDEPAAVAGALAGLAALDLGDVAGQLERRLEVVVGRVAVVGVHPVDRDAAAHHAEAGVGAAQRGGGVRGVDERVWMALDPAAEGRELLVDERLVVLVGGGEVRHQAHEPVAGRLGDPGGLVGVARAEPPHPGVELDVHAGAGAELGDERLAPGDDVGAGGHCHRELLVRQRAHHQHRAVDARAAQLGGLGRRRHREPGGAAPLRRACGRHGPVPVAVGLDDRAQARRRDRGGQPRAVALDRARVDAGERPEHVRPRRRPARRARRRA